MKNENNSATEKDNNESPESNEMLLLLGFNPTFADIESKKSGKEVKIAPSSGCTKKKIWPDNETNTDWVGPDSLSKILMFPRNYFLSIRAQADHAVNGVIVRIALTFKTTTIFVTEKEFVESFVILSKIRQYVKSTRWIGDFFKDFMHRNLK